LQSLPLYTAALAPENNYAPGQQLPDVTRQRAMEPILFETDDISVKLVEAEKS
jgi:hypothetical protein